MEKKFYYKFYLKTTVNNKEVLTFIDECPIIVRPILSKAFGIPEWTFISHTKVKYRLNNILGAYLKLMGNSQRYWLMTPEDGWRWFEDSKRFMKNILEACYKNQEHKIVIKLEVDKLENKYFVEQKS
jgi:hypothetical protein